MYTQQLLFILWLILLVLVICFVTVRYIRGRKRAGELSALAADLGFSYVEEGDEGFFAAMERLSLFAVRNSGRARHILSGRVRDTGVTVFDHEYRERVGGQTRRYQQTVLCLRSGALALPTFSLRPERLIHRIGGALGYQDLDFPSHPQFSRLYLLRSEEEEGTRRLFKPEVLSFYEGHKNRFTEGSGSLLVHYRSKKMVRPGSIRLLIDEGMRILELFAS